ncbi:CAP domain-containing protein [Pontibacillus sp. HMF3514]|uniref:CAP domain-containing protein n=1 Tax=Pontibacillus sp. HMF3514 TaxID=2692425 RepID=UPI00131FEFC3|nr:CAP domain-containing protein [Pontibacillus sp. HMF3514]QHE52871.1 serine protease [Pontibacillus sp. HMF3514]
MSKVLRVFLLLIIAGVFWNSYGDSIKQSGINGAFEEIQEDIDEIKENPKVSSAITQFERELRYIMRQFQETLEGVQQPESDPPAPEKPELNTPNQHSFSIHNIEIGDTRAEVEQSVGTPKRSSMNEYGVQWVTYHENYHNFFMTAYNEENKVVGLYTNQDLLTSKLGINFTSTRDSVLETLDEPLQSIRKGFTRYKWQSNEEYDVFSINENYVTIFYDKHQSNKVTAIQIISSELEQKKKGFYPDPSDQLKKGFEYQLFDITNAARVKHDLSPLSWADSVRKTARAHSLDMAENNFFSHENLEGQSPFDRMNEDNIPFITAGENIAAGQLSSIYTHAGLMNSLGHRKNILHSKFEMLAVGVAFNEDSRPYYTENFLTK